MSALPVSALPVSALPVSALPVSALALSATALSATALSATALSATALSAAPVSAFDASLEPASASVPPASGVEGHASAVPPPLHVPLPLSQPPAQTDHTRLAQPPTTVQVHAWVPCDEQPPLPAVHSCTQPPHAPPFRQL